MSGYYDSRALARELEEAIDYKRIYEDLLVFSELERYTGEEAGEAAAAFILKRLKDLGIEAEEEVYPVYRSLPIDGATVKACGRTLKSIAFVYSAPACGFKGTLVYDRMSEGGRKCSQLELQERVKPFKGKIVLTYDESFDFARAAAKAGAAAIVTIWKADLLHHGTLGGVWGAPEPEQLLSRYPMIPCTEIGLSDGRWLAGQIQKGGAEAELNIEMKNGVVNSTMALGNIKGKSEHYVLVSGHYDSWWEGITDNGVANVFMLELARLLKERQDKLGRSVKLAWWTGHSDGRYAGSTYYFDKHYAEIKKNCVAHLNMDICGCRGSDLVGLNTARLEGRQFNFDFLADFNEGPVIEPVPMARFADQTFWGADVPFTIMPKYAMREGSFFWWHTAEDTIDKVDPDIVMRDGKVITRLTAIFANGDVLPARFTEFADWMKDVLTDLKSGLSEDFDLEPVFAPLAELREELVKLEGRLGSGDACDDIVMKVGGPLTRLVYTAASPYGQDPAVDYGLFPGMNIARGLTKSNTTPEYYLAARTAFVRQRNRFVDVVQSLKELIEKL